jgi:hypothetical protein
MARLKLYYPVDEITTNLYTSGQEWMTLDKKEYVGLYHTYTTGETYTQPIWKPRSSVQLIPYYEISPDNNKNIMYQQLTDFQYDGKYVSPKSISPQIKKQDILNGNIQRFFFKKHNEFNIIETNRLQYQQWQNGIIDTKLYTAIQINWYITGNIDDEIVNGYVKEGVASKNKKQIALASKQLPLITSHLTNLTEFYIDATFTIPADINGLDS